MPLLKTILNKLKDIDKRVNKRIIKKGKRNTYYLIGIKNAEYSGGSSAGTLVLFVNNLGEYQQSIPGYLMVNANGQCFKHSIGVETKTIKSIICYTDNNNDYIFLYAKNYHDNYYVDLVSSYNFTLDVEEMTADEFNAYVANMTKLSEA